MKVAPSRKKSPFRIGFLAALLAGIIASGVMFFINITWGGILLPDVFGSKITAIMPPTMFEFLHQLIGADAKTILFFLILAGQILVFALSGGIFYALLKAQGGRLRWYHGLLLAAILWLFAGVVLLPLTDGGLFGANLNAGIGSGMVSLGAVSIVFGLSFIYLTDWLPSRPTVDTELPQRRAPLDHLDDEEEEPLSRRAILTRGLVFAGIAVAGVGIWRFITGGASAAKVPVAKLLQHYKSKIVPPPIPKYGTIQPAPYLSPEITSNDQFYIVSKNLAADPTVDGSTWQLTVDGQVAHPFTLNYSELMALPRQLQYESLMCISNDVGGPYMSNARWEGIPLLTLLQRAGIKTGATKIVFHAVDDYADSIHLSKALEPTTLLAVKMNGLTLPQGHGFPVRMLVPGIYGMKHCKWLTRIEVINYDFQGYWQQRGWDDAAPVRMTSRIDTPLDGSTVPIGRLTYIAGVAFSGDKGISEVDISLDSGQTWHPAILKRPPSDFTWVIWEYPWTPTTKSVNVFVTVRAIDLEGNVQDPTIAPPLPNGSSGYHSILVLVS